MNTHAASNMNGLAAPSPWYSQPPTALPSSNPAVSPISSKLTARPRRCTVGTLTMAVVATVANIAQPTPPNARKPRKTV